MKLLSRFIWLIVAISIIVFAGISTVHFRADKKLKQIKTSISQEYDLLIDKMLSPERSEINSTYNYGLSNSSTTVAFLSTSVPMPDLLKYDLDAEVMNHFKVDAVWFYKPDGTFFYFVSNHDVNKDLLMINSEEIGLVFKNDETSCNFYINSNNMLYRVFGSKVGDIHSPSGYVFSATLQDDRWIKEYEKEINNSTISFAATDAILPPLSKEIIRIERPLLSYDGSTVQNMIITLKLPFLSLWQSSSVIDKWLTTGAMLLTVFFLIISLILWVITPLNKISKSLEKGNSHDIKPLLNNKTEMGNVARMIGDYHQKTDELEVSESIKRHIIEQVQVGIIIADATSNIILTTNPHACKLIIAPEESLKGNTSGVFLEQLSDEQLKIFKNKKTNIESYESKLFNSKGAEIPVLRTTSHITMDGKEAIMDTFVDLSEIKNLQSKLEEEKKKLSLAVKNSGLVFCEYNFPTDDVTISEEWKFLFNGDKNNNAQNFISNIYPSDTRKITDHIDSILSEIRDTITAEFRVKHPERGIIWLKVSVLITKRDGNKKPKQLIGLLEDITERISVQQELIKAK